MQFPYNNYFSSQRLIVTSSFPTHLLLSFFIIMPPRTYYILGLFFTFFFLYLAHLRFTPLSAASPLPCTRLSFFLSHTFSPSLSLYRPPPSTYFSLFLSLLIFSAVHSLSITSISPPIYTRDLPVYLLYFLRLFSLLLCLFTPSSAWSYLSHKVRAPAPVTSSRLFVALCCHRNCQLLISKKRLPFSLTILPSFHSSHFSFTIFPSPFHDSYHLFILSVLLLNQNFQNVNYPLIILPIYVNMHKTLIHIPRILLNTLSMNVKIKGKLSLHSKR